MSIINDLLQRHPEMECCRQDICEAVTALVACFERGGRLYIVGNGGSAADALHITGELVKSFTKKRTPDERFTERVKACAQIDNAQKEALQGSLQGALPVFPLVENSSLATAFANDCNAEFTFAQQVYAYAREGDCVLGISTSGNSTNIIHALAAAKGRGAVTIGMTGAGGGKMKALCDICICVPESEVHLVQELHLPVYHAVCMALEEHFWGEAQTKRG